ncbi:endo-1,4-beta-xylanase [Candidatus Poriferisocius sp.]|uniref:endo-1,4-beta-xylanase n=1 Tax=Candidatus Poriferisocius sp. TaxID=3101276 RepID=UPI003B5B5BD4
MTTVRAILEQVEQAVNASDADFTATFQFVCEPEGTYRLVVVDGQCDLRVGAGEAVSTVVADADDAVLIFSGKADSMKAFMEGRMRIEGDLMAMSVLTQFTAGGTRSTGGPPAHPRVGYLAPAESPSHEWWREQALEASEGRPLRQVAADRGLHVGAAIATPSLPSADALVPREFNQVGAENAFKWGTLAKRVGEYDFSVADAFVRYAQRHDLRLRGHTLIWGRAGRPTDLEATIRAASDPTATLRQLMGEHIDTVLNRYRGQVAAWDVVNEPMAYGGEGLDRNVFSDHLGDDYVAEAFAMARSVDTEVDLVLNEQIPANQYNDVGGEQFHRFAEKLIGQGVPIDGIGIQGHQLMSVPDPVELRDYLRRIEDLGVFIEITEMDMRIGLFADRDDPLGAQAEAYHRCAEVLASVPAVRAVMFWGAADTDTWLDHFPPFDAAAPNQPLLFDRNLEPKPAYYAFLHGLATTP